jgi:hypothetical protein
MKLEDNVKNVKAFLPPKKEVVTLSSGKEFEYTLRIGMGHSMNARSKLFELLKHCGIKYEDLFGSDEVKENETDRQIEKRIEEEEKKKQKAKKVLQDKFMSADEPFRKTIIAIVAIILKQKEEWVTDNIEEEDILPIVVPFFLLKVKSLKMGWLTTVTRMSREMVEMQEKELEEMSKLVTENSLPGASNQEESQLPTSPDSSTPLAQEKL